MSEYKSFNSKFLGILKPFSDKTTLKYELENLRKEHPKANHICYAYRIGYRNEEVRANDDGEPSGSAGNPILNQLYSFGVQNCILFVIRYFGGTKLGIPGLIEAYKETAFQCLNIAELVEDVETENIELILEDKDYYSIIKLLKTNDITICESIYIDGKYRLNIAIPYHLKTLITSYL